MADSFSETGYNLSSRGLKEPTQAPISGFVSVLGNECTAGELNVIIILILVTIF